MTTFNELLALDPPGHVWLLDVSLDNFATVLYRWSDKSTTVAGNNYQARLAFTGSITRGLGRDGFPESSKFEVLVANDDFVADWLVDRGTVAQWLFKARFKLALALYDPTLVTDGSDPSLQTKVVGTFKCLDRPARDAGAVRLQLSDDAMGLFDTLLASPTVREWKDNAGSTVANCPIKDNYSVPAMDWDTPIQLAWGGFCRAWPAAKSVDVQNTGSAWVAATVYGPEIGTRVTQMGQPIGSNAAETEVYELIVPGTSGAAGPGANRATHHAARIDDGTCVWKWVGHYANLAFNAGARFPIIVCATTSPDNAVTTDVGELNATFSPDSVFNGKANPWAGMEIRIPSTFTVPAGSRYTHLATPGDTVILWTAKKSASITKSGVAWKILWVEFDVDAYVLWFTFAFNSLDLQSPAESEAGFGNPFGTAGTSPNYLFGVAPVGAGAARDAPYRGGGAAAMEAFSYFAVYGYPLSSRTQKSTPVSGVEVIEDLVNYYSYGGASSADAALFAAAKQSNGICVCGTINPSKPSSDRFKYSSLSPVASSLRMGDLRQALSEIASAVDVDLFMTWSGQVGIRTGFFNFATRTATPWDLPETRCRDVVDRIPSTGERWEPYNRLYILGPDGGPKGPYDNALAIAAWGTIIQRTVNGRWLQGIGGNNDQEAERTAWQLGSRVESVVRPVIRCGADREVLRLELGEQFTFTWTRGGNTAVYSAALFQLESMAINPNSLDVVITAVWVGDEDRPYILDDETMPVVVSNSLGRTAIVQDANPVANFTTGDMIADGVQIGDILVLKDSTQAGNVFTRYRAIRVVDVVSANKLQLEASDLDFSSPGGVAVVDWEILRGWSTYSLLEASSPGNYPPNTAALYGKACDAADVFSNTTTAAHKLL